MPSTTADLYRQPITQRIDALLQLSRQHAERFCSPDAWLARQRYMAKHPTSIVVMKCMDGRIHIPHATQTPLGIITPFRNLGGIFDLGWPYLGELLTETVLQATQSGRATLLLITYHFSSGHPARGVRRVQLRCRRGQSPRVRHCSASRPAVWPRPSAGLPARVRL